MNNDSLTPHPLHSLSPYVGRLATHRARELIARLGKAGGTIADPFCGSGTIPLEGWQAGMNVIACDRSPYAMALTRAKLFPTATLDVAMRELAAARKEVSRHIATVDLRKVPAWIRAFYHPETLREAIAWAHVLQRRRCWLLFGCFLNLLHHQRPGFLSFPASHATPYLRTAKYPLESFPELYQYRDVESRLIKKLARTLKASPPLDMNLQRSVKLCDASKLLAAPAVVDCIVTSPPYMSGLSYARDNRLRLWFCGVSDWTALEASVSPGKQAFLKMMNQAAARWEYWLRPKGYLAIVLGDIHRDKKRIDVAQLVQESIRQGATALSLVSCEDQLIPEARRLIKRNAGTLTETTLIFRRRG